MAHRSLLTFSGMVLAALLLVGVGLRAVESRRLQGELERANREIASGRYEAAREVLVRLSRKRPGWAEVAYHLGFCELAEGRPDGALAAWSRLPPESPWASRVALPRARVLRDLGRFAEAEAVLEPASQGRDARALEARQELVQLYLWQGRTAEARRTLQEVCRFSPSSQRAKVLRELWLLEADATLHDTARLALEAAVERAPEDDRLWLGLANLATRQGRFDEASRWLEACRRRRPSDPAVWRAVLDWARASGHSDEAARALAHLPSDRFSTAEVFDLRAWFAALQGQRNVERHALERLLDTDPGHTKALERLTALALEDGQTDRAHELRRRKAEIDQASERYHRLLRPGPPPVEDAETLARLAETLGRGFEARGWWSLASQRAPSQTVPDPPDRLRQPARDASPQTLADLLADLIPPAPASPRTVTSPQPETGDRAITFTDEAEAAGLRFVFDHGQTAQRQLPETMSGGVALLDYDGDGWLDVYVVQGGPFPPPADAPNADRLFRNKGDGTFRDVTEQAGLAAFSGGYGHGVTVADYDNDGHPDLFITRWRSYALYRNKGDGTFEDVTAQVGLDGDQDWPTSAAFADFDGDGWLDLYVCHYLVWEAEDPQVCEGPAGSDYPSYCDPRLFEALPDRLYRNDGGRFVEVTEQAGITAPDGRGLGVVAADLDGDGLIDLYVANDTTANFFYRNQGDFTFEELGHETGLAGNAEGGYQAGMGIALGDCDGDGRPDLAVTNFYGEGTTFYQNLGDGLFSDRTAAIGLMTASRYLLGFGIAFLDANNDGRLDLATTYGHINDYRPLIPYGMPVQLLRGVKGGRLVDVTTGTGEPWDVPRVGRGLAVGNLDNDGRLDLVILAQNEPLALFRNHTEQAGHFLTLKLEGTASNRDAIGAVVTVEAGGRRQTGFRYGGGSYQSANDPRLHFGLGESERVEVIEVRWPSGQVDRYEDLPADTGYHLIEGDPEPRLLHRQASLQDQELGSLVPGKTLGYNRINMFSENFM